MEYKINDLSVSEKEIEVTYSYDEIKAHFESEVKKQTKNIQLPGFRKGKAPVHLLKKMYGESLEHEASETIAADQFREISKEKHLHPIGSPVILDIKFKPGEEFYFKVKYEVVPQLEVKDYTGLEVEVPLMVVKDEEVESEIKYILKANSTSEPAEEVGDDNNFLLDVELTRVDENGKPFEGTKSQSFQFDLSNDGVDKSIIESSKKKKVGETFTYSHTFERNDKDEQGQEKKVSETFYYSALIKAIKKISFPELNEELIKKVTKDKVSSEEEFRENIKKDIQAIYDQRTSEMIDNKLIGAIVKNNDFNPPVAFTSLFLEEMVKSEEENAKKQGYKKFDRNEAARQLNTFAEYEAKWHFIKEAIIKKEKLEVSDEELNELAKKDAEETGISVDKLLNYYKSSNAGAKLLDKKMFDFLREKNTITKVESDKYSQKEPEEIK